MKNYSVYILLLICSVSICCVSKNKGNTAAIMEIKNIEGHYIDDKDMLTPVELIITKDVKGYKYEMTTPDRKLEGKISFSDNSESFYLDGIKWSCLEIDGDPQESPESVEVRFDENGLLIQNRGGNSMSGVYYVIFDDIDEMWIDLMRKYITLPNGITVDVRIPQDVVDMIIKRFKAIENGDIAAFRSTLGPMEDGVDYYYQLGLICEFFGDFFGIDYDTFHEAVADGSEKLTEIANTLFYGEHPLKSRNTGLVIKKIEITDTGGLKVTAKNKKNKEIIYNFPYY
ncbi:hypothetical protein R84B8_01142 [Treponema sp. R8-4-B8]